jgi:Tfp pilus assembly protein PilO
MNASADRRVLFALLGVAVLCLIGLGASLYHSRAAKLTELREELGQKEAQFDEARDRLTKLPQLETEFSQLQARLSVLEPALPDSAYVPTFLRQIERLATDTRNRILMIRPKPAIERRPSGPTTTINDETGEIIQSSTEAQAAEQVSMPYDYVPIELRLEGTYWTVIDFLAELQRFPKMIAVNDMAFDPTSGGINAQRSPQLTATMGLTAVVTKGEHDAKSG